MKEIKKILFHKEKKFYIKNIEENAHTQYGFVKKEDLKAKPGTVLKSNTGKEFTICEPSFMDRFEKIKRGAQIIPLKDIASIIAECGITKDTVVVDSGSGSAALAIMLANFAKKVHTFELREDHYNIVKKNIEYMNAKNVIAKVHDIYESCPVKDADLFTLDLPEPWKAIKSVKQALKVGGHVVSYSPCIPQVSDFVETLREESNFIIIKVIEIIQREWEVTGRKIRPRSTPIGHSGFLTFARRVK